jgi:two-component system OmpR family sensor kinase/two-component system sensor histidine kinase BaeS
MHTIRMRLTLAFVLVALLAGSVTTAAILGTTHSHFTGYRNIQNDMRIAEVQELLGAYYAAQGSWQGVSDLLMPSHQSMMSGMQHIMGTGMSAAMTGMMALMDLGASRVRLVGEDGRLVADSAGTADGQVSQTELAAGYPVVVGGRTVGTLLLDRPAVPPMSPLDQQYTRSVTVSALLSGLAAALAAGLVGLILARRITKPVITLAATADKLAGRDLGARVRVQGHDELATLAQQFNRMAEQLERQEQSRRSMVADVAHELRTPVAILRGQFEALQDGAIEPTPEVLLPLHDEVLRLGRLLDDLQALSLADAGRLPLQRRLLSPGSLAEAASAAFAPAAQDKAVAFQCVVAPNLPEIDVDADRLKQVLLNLLGNALRHTTSGHEITLRLEARESDVVFSVADTGEGIAAEDLPHVFDRFYRAEKSRSRASGGSGLGLAISRGIVEAHGGLIWAESTVGQGSHFSFTIPACHQIA